MGIKVRTSAALALAALFLQVLPAGAVTQPDGHPAIPGSVECEAQADPIDGPRWISKMPESNPTSVTTEDVRIKSKDGTRIALRIYRPDGVKGPLPTVLKMTPYNATFGYHKETEDLGRGNEGLCWLLTRGYAFVLGDVRGTHNSGGCLDLGGPLEQQDGHAVVQWLAKQKWSNGKIGMYGVSYDGMSQYSAAVKSPPALKAIIPIAPVSSWWRYLYSGGVHYETNMGTPGAMEYAVALPPPTNAGDEDYAENVMASTCNTELVAQGMSLDGTMTKLWKERDYARMAEKIKAAVFHVHGWLDENVKMDHFDAIWEAMEKAGTVRKALIGPWQHQEPTTPNWHLTALRWFEHWLNDNDTGMMDEPRVTYIDQNKFMRTSSSWPASNEKLVLEPGQGKLLKRADEGEAAYQDIPHFRRRFLRDTEGVRALYTGAELASDVRLSGTPVFELEASIDKDDTNFVVHLYDIDHAGTATYVSRGYLDARLRTGFDDPHAVTPGERFVYRVELHGRDYVFAEGHRIEILVASSDSCHWSEEPGCTSSGVVSDATAAQVTLTEGARAKLILPIAPTRGGKILVGPV